MKKTLAFLSLFTSVSTLFCCALPALFVVLGFGAAFAGLTSAVPQLYWVSEYKVWFFSCGALFLVLSGALQWRNREEVCAVDEFGVACATTRDWSRVIFWISVALYAIGFTFAFIAPNL